MQAMELKKELENRVLLMDGAMGTYFAHLHPEDGEVEQANRTHPEWIAQIHREYIENGARLIRTNTFAVNHGLFPKEELDAIIGAAVRNAKVAVEFSNTADTIYIAGSIGPIRMEKDDEENDVLEEYHKICDSLIAHGIRIFVMETFSDVYLAKKIAAYIKGAAQKTQEPDTFVQVQFSVNRMGYSLLGQSVDTLVSESEACSDIDGLGFNCGIGAAHMNTMLGKVSFSSDKFLSVLPNAGYEQGLQGRHFLIQNMEYYANAMLPFLEKGVNLIGGCCGTTPMHIRELAKCIGNSTQPVSKRAGQQKNLAEVVSKKDNRFISKLDNKEMVYVVEIDSPFNGNAERFLNAAQDLKDNDVDLITISDSPMAKPRAEAIQMGNLIASKTGACVMPHICCRDRNLIGLRSSMLAAHIHGVRDMLIITGDPVSKDDRGIITSVYDMNSIRLMEYVKKMNEELFAEEPFYYGGALNYAGVNEKAIADRMQKKMDAGCSYFLTQPIFSDGDIQRVTHLRELTGAKVIAGIMPLVSFKNAMFMKNEMPGIHVPDEILEQYSPDMTREEATEVAVKVSVALGEKMAGSVDGYYFMTPFNRVDIVNAIITQLRNTVG